MPSLSRLFRLSVFLVCFACWSVPLNSPPQSPAFFYVDSAVDGILKHHHRPGTVLTNHIDAISGGPRPTACWRPTRSCAVNRSRSGRACHRGPDRSRPRSGRNAADELGQASKRVFDIEMWSTAPTAGGALKIIAAIEDPPGDRQILVPPGLPARAPPRSSAQRFYLSKRSEDPTTCSPC